ncbi:MAG: PKD domain-containing protein, partial [Blastocatellia bacterium]
MTQDPEGNPNLSAQTCTVNCSATVPATAQPNAQVLFQAMVEATGCTATPTFRWNFGDGTPVSTSQNASHSYPVAGTYQWSLTASVASGSNLIETVAGGLGEGNPATQATIQEVPQLARDPLGRGVYLIDSTSEFFHLRFINTSDNAVTVAGVTIAPREIRSVAGGGTSLNDNIPAQTADLAVVTGLAVSSSGNLVYLLNNTDGLLRVINVSSAPVTVNGTPLGVGQIRTLSSGLGQGVNGLAVHPSTGEVHLADATSSVNRIFKASASGTLTPVVGNAAVTSPTEAFVPGAATSIPLLIPRAIRFDTAGNLFVADTGHGRVIRVDGAGNATLVHQFPIGPQVINAFPSGLAHFGGSLYSANGNQQTITRLAPSTGATIVAGQAGASCDYTVTNCGDGRPGAQAGFSLLSSASVVPLASIDADGSGIFIADQGTTRRGRIRYLNLSGTAVTLAGISIPAG